MQHEWRHVAEQLNARMAQIPIDQAELARRADVSDATIRGLMSGTPRATSPRLGPLRKVSAALGWTPDSIERILAGDKPKPTATADADVLVRLAELERRQLVTATELRRLAAEVEQLAGAVVGRRRGEGNAFDR